MFFRRMFCFDKMIITLIILFSECRFPVSNTIFLILSNVKISSLLERFKMNRNELFSKNGDSTCIS